MAIHDFAAILCEMIILGKALVAGDWLRAVDELLKVVVLSGFDDCCVVMLVLYIHDCIILWLFVVV